MAINYRQTWHVAPQSCVHSGLNPVPCPRAPLIPLSPRQDAQRRGCVPHFPQLHGPGVQAAGVCRRERPLDTHCCLACFMVQRCPARVCPHRSQATAPLNAPYTPLPPRPTWTPSTATRWPSCAWCRVRMGARPGWCGALGCRAAREDGTRRAGERTRDARLASGRPQPFLCCLLTVLERSHSKAPGHRALIAACWTRHPRPCVPTALLLVLPSPTSTHAPRIPPHARTPAGKFEKGMKVKVARTGRTVTLAAPQRMFANERSTVQEGFAGGSYHACLLSACC